MRHLFEFGVFTVLGLFALGITLFIKHLSFTYGWFGVTSDSLGMDGILVWLCLMVPVRLIQRAIIKKAGGTPQV